MAVEDITATGGHDLKGIRNPDLYQPSPTEIKVRQRAQDLSMGRVGYEDTGAPGWSTPVPMPELGDFGASRYDSDLLVNPQDQWDVANLRAANQPALAKWAAAVPQAVTTAGTTFMQGTLGLLYGAGAAIGQGEFNKLWNNDFTAAMDSVNKAVQEIAPIYQSQDEQENPLRNLFHAGPLAQNLGQLVGFIAGAAYSGAAYMKAFEFLGRGIDALRVGKGAFKAVSSLATSSKNNMATQAAASILGANGEATIEAYGNIQDWANLKKMQLEDVYRANRDDILAEASTQAAKEINPYDYETSTDYFTALELRASQIADESYKQRLAEIEDASVRMGNVIWAENMALLGFTHYKLLGRIYSGGYRANKTLANFVRRTTNEAGETALEATKKGTVRNIFESLGKAAYEGVEEMSQSSFSKGAGYWVDKDIFEPIREKRNRFGEAETFNILTGLAEGVKDQLADPNNWVEFIMGMGAGMLPIPMPHRKTNGKIGIFRSPEMISTFQENREMNQLAEETVNRINAMRQDPKYQTLVDALVVDAVKENKKKGSMGDQFAYKSEDFGQLVNLVTALEKVDQVDLFTDQVQSVLDMEENAENGQVILEGLSKDGEVPEYLQNKAPEEIVREYKDKARQVMEDVKSIVTNSENIRATYGDSLSEESLSALAALKSQMDNWDRRYKEIGKKLPAYLRNFQVDPQDVNLKTIMGSLTNGNTPIDFRDEPLTQLSNRVRRFVTIPFTEAGYTGDSVDQITNDIMDMYRLGMSMRNGLVTFNYITSNPESFNRRVEKENKKEEKKKQKENVNELRSRYDNVRTMRDLRNLEASATPEDYAALIRDLETSRDPKLKELNQKQSLLRRLTGTIGNMDIPADLVEPINDVIEEVLDNTPVTSLQGADAGLLFEAPISNLLSRLLTDNNFGLSIEQIQALPQEISKAIQEALAEKKTVSDKVPEVAPPVKDDGPITFTDGQVWSPMQEVDSAEDAKDIADILSPTNPKSENPTVEPVLNNTEVEQDTSRENTGEISGGVSEVNFHALKNTGEVIIPANREAWNTYARANGLREVDDNFARIYNYLVEKGAYKYLNEGHLKVNTPVVAFIDNTMPGTIFYGVPLKGLNEIESVNDLQVIQAAPARYEIGDKTIRSKDGSVILGVKGLTVSQVFNGKFRYSEDSPLSSQRINSLFPEGVTPDWTIGVISNNGQIYSRKPLTEEMIAHDIPFNADYDGRVYLFVKGPNGKYMPLSLRVDKFEGDYTGPIGEGIDRAVNMMANVINEKAGKDKHPLLNAGLEALSKFLYTGDLIGVITTFPVGPGIPTRHLALIRKGKNGNPDRKQYIQLQAATFEGAPRSKEEVANEIKEAFVALGMNYQVAKNSLRTDKNYENFLVNSGILSSNVVPAPVVDTNFTLVDNDYGAGRVIPTPQPAPANPSPVTEEPTPTSTPVKEPPKAITESTSFSAFFFGEALSEAPTAIQDILKPLEGKKVKIERQLMLATALLAPDEVLNPLGGREAVIISIMKSKLSELKDTFKKANFTKNVVPQEKRALYSRIRQNLMSNPVLDDLYESNKAKLTDNKDRSVSDVNKFQKDLEITNKLLTFAELTESQRGSLSKMGITEEEFNSWNKDQQNKAIECYS